MRGPLGPPRPVETPWSKTRRLIGTVRLQRAPWKMVPGLISWAIILGPIWLSFSYPWLVAYFVLTFDFYMLCRLLWLAVTVIIGYRRMRRAGDELEGAPVRGQRPGARAPKAGELSSSR